MQIHNVRLGVATNSSSSHSVLLCPTAKAFGEAGGSYGWEDFLLKGKQDKAHYFACQVYQNLQATMEHEYAWYVTNGLLNRDALRPPKKGEQSYEAHYIDHQSVWCLPREYHNPKLLCQEFILDLQKYILENDDLAIAGGNDNAEVGYPYGGEFDAKVHALPFDTGASLTARKDGQYWVLFNRSNGTKIRLSFAKDAKPYTQSSTPELVDYSITDYCPYACRECYKDSTVKGKHAEDRWSVIGVLGDLEVFELAMGGGEPTMHPDFADILYSAHLSHILPTFTTFTLKWTENKTIENNVLQYAGGFALSVMPTDYQRKIEQLSAWCKTIAEKRRNLLRLDYPRDGFDVGIQCILGLLSTEQIVEIIQLIQKSELYPRRLTLLGYKSFGRGEYLTEVQKVDLKPIFAAAKENWVNISMDTVAVKEYEADLDDENVPQQLRTNMEGAFSMYIDGVKGTIAKDSYSHKKFEIRKEKRWDGVSMLDRNHLARLIGEHFPFE